MLFFAMATGEFESAFDDCVGEIGELPGDRAIRISSRRLNRRRVAATSAWVLSARTSATNSSTRASRETGSPSVIRKRSYASRSTTRRSLRYWLVEKICNRFGSASGSRSNSAAVAMGFRDDAMNRSRLLIAMSGSASAGAAAAS
jgi:hypothetical protein